MKSIDVLDVYVESWIVKEVDRKLVVMSDDFSMLMAFQLMTVLNPLLNTFLAIIQPNILIQQQI